MVTMTPMLFSLLDIELTFSETCHFFCFYASVSLPLLWSKTLEANKFILCLTSLFKTNIILVMMEWYIVISFFLQACVSSWRRSASIEGRHVLALEVTHPARLTCVVRPIRPCSLFLKSRRGTVQDSSTESAGFSGARDLCTDWVSCQLPGLKNWPR